MRDIRSDLEERHFEKVMQQLQHERTARVADLKGTLAMIDKLMQFEIAPWTK